MMKNRQNSVRTYDEDGYARRAGCICFKNEQEKEVFDTLFNCTWPVLLAHGSIAECMFVLGRCCWFRAVDIQAGGLCLLEESNLAKDQEMPPFGKLKRK